MKAINANLEQIMNNIDRNEDANPFYTRQIDRDKVEDQIDNLTDSLGLNDPHIQSLFDELKKCHQKCPESVSVFCFEGTDIGISGVLPIKDSREAKSHYEGFRSKINSEMITHGKTNLILFHYIHLHPEYRDRFEVQQRIIACLLFKAALFMKDDKDTIIYAEAATSTCKRLLEKLGFVIYSHPKKDKNIIMALDFKTYKESENPVYARRTIKIIKKIRRRILEDINPPSCNNLSTC